MAFPDIFKHRDDDALVVGVLAALAIGVGAHTFIGPAETRKDRLAETAPVATLVFTALFGEAFGERRGEKKGIAIGYQIPNPDLAPARDAIVKAGNALTVAQAARDLIGDDRLPSWAKPVGRALDTAERIRDSLPPGWTRDDSGYLRDEHGRYASEDAAAKVIADE